MSTGIWLMPTSDTLPDDFEPTDEQLASTGINTYPTDPYDSPSYATLTKGNTK